MRRRVGWTALAASLAFTTTAFAQTQAPPQQPSGQTATPADHDTRPSATTTFGDTGIWFVPTAEVLPNKKWSVSFQRTNIDDGQGFADISTFPATFGIGFGGRVEVFGSWALVTRIDRDTRPLFFTSAPGSTTTGTGGGLLVNYPLDRKGWIGNQLGDLWLGAKFNLLSQHDEGRPMAVAARVMVKAPVGSDTNGASSGKADFAVDAIVSHQNPVVELSGFAGLMVRGNPAGYKLTNGLRWGVGAAFPQRYSLGLRITTELYGEKYFDDAITAPPGLVGEDNSILPTSTTIKSPAVVALGLTWEAPNGFFIGADTSWNVHMSGRSDAAGPGLSFTNTPKDDKGFEVRLGFHPGVLRRYAEIPPTVAPPPPPGPPSAGGAPGGGGAQPGGGGAQPGAPGNRPPTVKAACDPCTVEVGKTSTVTADAQDPDGDPLTYRWTSGAGTVASPTNRQSLWTAPMTEGPVPVTVAVSDGRGGTASDTVTIQVVKAAVKEYNFEDVHFDFDRFSLRPEALKVLDDAVAAMQANPAMKIIVEGHTCNIGTAEYNLALGERRARSVRDYLISRGISADRLTTVSYGEENPKYDNSREETRRLNRRAVLTVRLQLP